MPEYERHPLSAEYSDLEGREWETFLDGFRNHGFLARHAIALHDGMILDGWQRYRACLALEIVPTFEEAPWDIPPEEYVKLVNDERRHETAAAKAKRVADRRARVAAARGQGKSVRAIAATEGVSKTQVERDLGSVSAGVPGGTPETKPAPATPSTVTGRDGKTYPAAKPSTNGKHETNGHATLPKVGKPIFDDRQVTDLIGKLIRTIDARADALGEMRSTWHREMLDGMETVTTAWNRAQASRERKRR